MSEAQSGNSESSTTTTYEYEFTIDDLPKDLLEKLKRDHPEAQFEILKEDPEEEEEEEEEEQDAKLEPSK